MSSSEGLQGLNGKIWKKPKEPVDKKGSEQANGAPEAAKALAGAPNRPCCRCVVFATTLLPRRVLLLKANLLESSLGPCAASRKSLAQVFGVSWQFNQCLASPG